MSSQNNCGALQYKRGRRTCYAKASDTDPSETARAEFSPHVAEKKCLGRTENHERHESRERSRAAATSAMVGGEVDDAFEAARCAFATHAFHLEISQRLLLLIVRQVGAWAAVKDAPLSKDLAHC